MIPLLAVSSYGLLRWLASSAVAQAADLSREQSQRAALMLVLLPLIGALLSFALLRYYGQLAKRRDIDEKRIARVIAMIIVVAFVLLVAGFSLAAAFVR